jgi:thymidylate synthase
MNEPQEQIVTLLINALEGFQFGDIDLVGYNPHPKIQMDMSV